MMFFTNGVLFASLLPHYPEFKRAFELSNSEFGLLVVAFPVGALLAAGMGGRIIRRFGTLATNAWGSVGLGLAMTVAAFSHSVWLFAAALLIGGAIDAVIDAAQNVQGVVVEQWRGRSVLNSFHALWSAGAAVGGGVSALTGTAGIPLGPQIAVSSALWTILAVIGCRLAVVPDEVKAGVRDRATGAGTQTRPGQSARGSRVHAVRMLLPLVVLAICGTLVEDVANNWAVLYVGQVAGAPLAIAGLALTLTLSAQFVGRILGDPMTDRWGRLAVARAGGMLIALGALLIAGAPDYPLALTGFALTGIGGATLVPAAFAGAGRVPGLPEGTGVAVLGWLMRIGFLVTSPAIGALSDLTNLRTAMLIPAAAGLATAAVAHLQRNRDVQDPEASFRARTATSSSAGRR